jgi:hypothetical protein
MKYIPYLIVALLVGASVFLNYSCSLTLEGAAKWDLYSNPANGTETNKSEISTTELYR